ncbi:hypothetical protein [Ferruginibacter albus]|uniref:hypothetical protein n=1 Tax=Ferruginibacter albus TaxID=2875540 RepID=UPI001CC3A207|nr:hypothetical protein [Ferruginibacter albus]UAY51190.1 hypothetical protein K9M53_11385 [Ferruginibacter albus]
MRDKKNFDEYLYSWQAKHIEDLLAPKTGKNIFQRITKWGKGILVSFLFLFSKCSYTQTYFPDSLSAKNNKTSKRVMGSRLFLVVPADYEMQLKSIGYYKFKKNSSTGFHIDERFDDNFYSATDGFLKSSFILKTTTAGMCKKVKVGNFDGIYYKGSLNMPADKQKTAFLMFGDSSFKATVSGYFLPGDKIAETEINNILTTVGYDTSIIPDRLEVEDFKFNQNITGFKYVSDGSENPLVYSIDGVQRSIQTSKNISSFELRKYKCNSIDSAKKIIKLKVEGLTKSGLVKSTSVQQRNIQANGNAAYEMIMDGQGKYLTGIKFYAVIIQKENMGLLFWGVDRNNGEWMDKFKSTVQSITID